MYNKVKEKINGKRFLIHSFSCLLKISHFDENDDRTVQWSELISETIFQRPVA